MAQASTDISGVVKRFCKELAGMGIPSERVLLFGSQALGTAQEGSDIDLVVISRAWVPYNERERLEMLGVAAARILEPIQARGTTPEEMTTHRISAFLEQALKEQAIVVEAR